MARSKTRRKRGATYDTQPIQKGLHYSVTPRIPRACSSALIPMGVKVNVPTGRNKNKTIFVHEKPQTAYCAR